MSQFKVSGLITMDAAQAQAALKATKAGLAEVGATGASAGRQAAAGADQATVAVQRQTVATGGLSRAQRTLTQQLLATAGASRALRAIGPALLSTLSPVNMLTFAAAALGATLADSLFGGGKAARGLTEELKEAEGAIDRMGEAAARGFGDLRKQFGSITPELRLFNEEVRRTTQRMAELEAQQAARAISALVKAPFGRAREAPLAEMLGGYVTEPGGGTGIVPEIARIDAMLTALGNSKGIGTQLELVQSLRREVLLAAGGQGQMTLEAAAFFDQLNQVEEMLRRIQAAQLGVGSAQELANAELRDKLALLQAENGIAAATLAFGRDSAQVAALRAAEERRVFEAMLAGSDASEALKDEMRAALAEGQRLAELNLAAGIRAAAGAAAALAEKLGISLDTAIKLAALGPQGVVRANPDPSGQVYSGRGSVVPTRVDAFIASTGGITPEIAARLRNLGRTAGGGGGGAAAAEADAVAELIARLRGEVEIAREANPVKAEMLRLREDLAGASAAERAEVEGLITLRERERAAMEALNYVADQTGTALIDALMGGKDAGEQLIRTLARAVAQAALLGTGPLAGLFGGVGILGILGGGGIQRRAGGGWITGPGGPTGDRIPALLSDGEFVVRAAAAARNRDLLEQINAGSPPRFARGGWAGSAPEGTAPGGGQIGTLRVDLAPGLRAEMRQIARDVAIDVVQEGLGAYDTERLPDRIAEIDGDRRRRG
ncbi:MAG: hypothetical protein KF887_07135 [Paracoccaceae bacterium]|nr:MAG: hypothetical protein KF887_07135 [Paracoccaceae bacterium]